MLLLIRYSKSNCLKFLCHSMINLGYKLNAACVSGQDTQLDRRKCGRVVWANHAPFLFPGT